MGVVFATYQELGRAAIAYSALEAGGFHPVMADYQHANNAAMYILALGGIRIMLPEHELPDAIAWMTYLKTQEIPADEPIPKRRFGQWFRATVMGLAIFTFIPLFFIPPIILFALWFASIILFIILGNLEWADFTFFFWVALLLHARYVAGPKILKGNADVD